MGADRSGAKHQSGVTANTVTKILLTGAALGATVYSGVLGAKTARAIDTPWMGRPSHPRPHQMMSLLPNSTLRYLQWALPALTGGIVVFGAQQGEQQTSWTGSFRSRDHSCTPSTHLRTVEATPSTLKDQHVSHPNNDPTTDKATADATSAFCADFLGDLDTPTDAAKWAWEKTGCRVARYCSS